MQNLTARNERFKAEIRTRQTNSYLYNRRRQFFEFNWPFDDLSPTGLDDNTKKCPKTERLYQISQYLFNGSERNASSAVYSLMVNIFGDQEDYSLQDVEASEIPKALVARFKSDYNSQLGIGLAWVISNLMGKSGASSQAWANLGIIEFVKFILVDISPPIEDDSLMLSTVYILANLCYELKDLRIAILQEKIFSQILIIHEEKIRAKKEVMQRLIWLISLVTYQITSEEITAHIAECEAMIYYLLSFVQPSSNMDIMTALKGATSLEFIESFANLCQDPGISRYIIQKRQLISQMYKFLMNDAVNKEVIALFELLLQHNDPDTFHLLFESVHADIYKSCLVKFASQKLLDVLFLLSQLALNDKNAMRLINDSDFLALFQKCLLDKGKPSLIATVEILGNVISHANRSNFLAIMNSNIVDLLLSGMLIKHITSEKMIIEAIYVFVTKAEWSGVSELDLIQDSVQESNFIERVETSLHNYPEKTADHINYIKNFLSTSHAHRYTEAMLH